MVEFRGRAAAIAADEARGKGSDFAQYTALPESEKERLCRSLLSEFGVTRITRTNDQGELNHCCCLPWHDESNPSASLNYKKLTYKCYGCGSQGGLLWFIGTCRQTSGTDARKWLNDQTGLGSDEQPLAALLSFFEAIYGPSGKNNVAPMPKMNPSVLNRWLRIHPYMTDVRNISEETLMRFKVGYGIIPVKITDTTWVDSERIVIPHFWKGDLVGWQTRRLYKDGTPKYKSSPDFPKDATIYNFDQTAKAPVIVESPMSVLSKAHLDIPIEGTFGASLTDRQCRLLSIHRRVVLFMDNDDAGWKATDQVAERLESYSEVFVVPSPWACDPCDMDDETYTTLVESAIPYSLWSRPQELLAWPSDSN